MGDINDIASIVMDEIALEGLDGITIEGLYVRLKERPEFASSLNDAYKRYIWNIICNLSEINMFVLPEPRKPLIIFNRYDYVDPDVGMVLEPETLPEEIYPHAPVDDKDREIRGSCAFYKERMRVYDLARKLSLQEVIDRWGMTLVIVASQKMRNLALMGSSVDPELELTILQYCILERVGRSRHLGEVTQGRVSLQITGEDPKALFYHRKFLMKNGLIVKQIHHQKSGTQNCSGSLLHLPRFYVERWPKVLFLTKRVVDILRGCKNYIADYEEIRKKLDLNNSLKKLFHTTYFQRFVRTDLRLPYRHLYPDAKENEWRSLNTMKEKMIRVIQLLDPNADVDIISARDDEFDIDDDEHGDAASSREEFKVTLNRSFLSQAYQCIEGAGVNGYSQMELVQKMGLSKLSARTVSRNLLKRGIASTFMNDVGRQRVSRFRARKWDQQCTRIQNIERDIQHMRAELLSKALGAGHEVPGGSVSGNGITSEQTKKYGKKRSAEVSINKLKAETETSKTIKRGSDSPIVGPPCKVSRIEASKCVEYSNATCKETGNLDPTELSLSEESIVPKELSDPSEPSALTQLAAATDLTFKMAVPVDSAVSSEVSTDTSQPTVSSPPPHCSVSKFQSKEALRTYFQHQSKDGPVMTYRIFKRINMILEYVKIHKVIDDHSKFLKLINEEEEREGLNMKIDKKSLLRLLIRLKEDGCLKLHSYLLTDGVKVKTMIFICEQNIPLDHPAIVSAIEQAKMKLFIVKRDNINLAIGGLSGKDAVAQRAQSKKQKMTFVYDKKIGRKYGFCPKFIRMRTLHQFLFYLMYGYEGNPDLDQNKVIPFLESKDVIVDESLRSELTQTYVLDIHWKMFIPPLPQYPGWPKGWSIMCDLLLRLPLSVFVRIFNVCYVVPSLNEYMQHPIRRHFLVRQLPVPMRNGLMAFRKYIFSIHEVVQRLCYIGLVQFGPQSLKEKDQVLVFVNRRTSLLDTVTSKPGYHQISEEEYPEVKYEFRCMQDVDSYWYNLWNICVNTQLGGRMCVQGKDIVLEQLAFKPQMQEALLPVRPSQAPSQDTGKVPGDRRGAAGLDSAIFAHLKRNWNWANISAKAGDAPPKKVDQRKFRLMNMKTAPVVFTKSAIIVKRCINYLHNGCFSTLRTERRSHTIPPGAEVLPKKGQKKQNVVRRIEARKKRSTSKPIYDDIDLKALQLMSKLRVEWSAEEDTLLLLCKVASMYLCPNPRQQTIAFSTIRDILHSSIPEAQNKTSRACQRRILYMLKNLATSNNLAMHLEELKQDEDICERFGKPEDNARSNLESSEAYETRIHEKYQQLVSELQGRSDRMLKATGSYCSAIPDQADDFWKLFDVVEPRTVIKSKGAFQDIKNIVDIHCSVVNSIIHSSLCSTTDKTSWAYQLFRVYQQYPDSLLRAAMAKLRQDQMVSLKKSYARYKQKANYLPLSSSPYQLSVSYLQLIQTKYQYGVYHEAYEMLKKLLDWKEESTQGMPVTSISGGGAAAMVESLCKKGVLLTVEIPEQVIILDPWFSEKDETYTRIVERYRDILQTYRTGRDSTTSALFRTNSRTFKESSETVADTEDDEEEMAIARYKEKQCKLPEQLLNKDASLEGGGRLPLPSSNKESIIPLFTEEEKTSEIVSTDLPNCASFENANLQNSMVSCPVAKDIEHSHKHISDEDQTSENHMVGDIFQENLQGEHSSSFLDTKEESSHTELLTNEYISVSKPVEIINVTGSSLLHSSSSSDSIDENAVLSLSNNVQSDDGKSTLLVKYSSCEIVDAKEDKSLKKENVTPVSAKSNNAQGHEVKTVSEDQLSSKEVKISFQKEPSTSSMDTSTVCSEEFTETTLSLVNPDERESNKAENCVIDQSNNVPAFPKQNMSKDTVEPDEIDTYQDKKNFLEMETTSCNRNDKTLSQKWSRLDFEWISDKEWDTEPDTTERGVEETDEPDGPDDDRIRGEYMNIANESDDSEGTTSNNQHTLVARAASRIALFMMKEEMDDPCQVKNTQHAHDFFVVNACSVFCKLSTKTFMPPTHGNNSTNAPVHGVTSTEEILPLTQTRIDEILDVIKREIIVDLKMPSEEEILDCVSEDNHPFIRAFVQYVESKKYLGVTLPQIQLFFENERPLGLEIAAVLKSLLEKHVMMRTGVTTPRYVHQRHVWPWLAHTFKFLRLEREKIIPSGSRVVTCSEEADNVMDIDSASEENIAEKTTKPEESKLEMKNINNSSTLLSDEEDIVDLNSTNRLYMKCDTIKTGKEDKMEINSLTVEIEENMETDSLTSETEKTMEVNSVPAETEGEKNNSMKEVTDKWELHKSKISISYCETSENAEIKTVDSSNKKGQGYKMKHLSAPHPLGTIVGTKDMRKAAQGFTFSEKDEIHIAIRPWVRINGTLNRRVLDRLLGAVLGHAMYQPGQTLHAFGRRFQPALQPFHTRELVEILQKLGCVELLVRKEKQKVTLFSKPQPLILVKANGTEDEQEIIVEPQADAICRLGHFIGEKSYAQDFMAAQEQMFSGRGPSDETSRKKKFLHEIITCGRTMDNLSASDSEENEENEESEESEEKSENDHV